MTATKAPDRRVLSQKVYDFLREKIINREYKPGEPILELSVSKELGVSRTPIREALKLLQQENLITVYPKRGAFITTISLDKLLEIFQIRQIVEREVAFLVSPYIDENKLSQIEQKLLSVKEAFDETKDADIRKAIKAGEELHDLMFSTLGNKTLIDIFAQLKVEILRGCDFLSRDGNSVLYHLEQHLEIIRALKERDREKAKTLVNDHLKEARKELIR